MRTKTHKTHKTPKCTACVNCALGYRHWTRVAGVWADIAAYKTRIANLHAQFSGHALPMGDAQ